MAINTSPTPDKSGRWVVSKFGDPSVLKWETWDPHSELPEDKVLVRIIVAGISGTDNLQRVGGFPNPLSSEPGFTPGYDCVGEVIALGSSVSTSLTVGDRVACLCTVGAHATHIVSPPTELFPLERSDDLLLACALPLNYMTAWGMLKVAGVHESPGSSILIGSASGGVGTAMAQLVRAFDLKLKMIGTCSPSKFDYLKSLGVSPVDRNAPDLVQQVRDLTDGQGVDVAYDSVGSLDSLQKSHQATKKDVGELIAVGLMAEITPDGTGLRNGSLDAHAILGERMQPRMKGWSMDRSYYDVERDVWIADFNSILGKVRTGDLVPEIAKLFRLTEAVEANEDLVSGTAVKGKMLFVVDADLAAEHDV